MGLIDFLLGISNESEDDDSSRRKKTDCWDYSDNGYDLDPMEDDYDEDGNDVDDIDENSFYW